MIPVLQGPADRHKTSLAFLTAGFQGMDFLVDLVLFRITPERDKTSFVLHAQVKSEVSHDLHPFASSLLNGQGLHIPLCSFANLAPEMASLSSGLSKASPFKGCII